VGPEVLRMMTLSRRMSSMRPITRALPTGSLRTEIFVLGEEIGFYVFDEDKWLWSPKDAMPARSLG
jgi:hypothetical protein